MEVVMMPEESPSPSASSVRSWVYFGFEVGPMSILTVAGAISIARGVLGAFELKQAVFGASLLVAAALMELFVWFMRRRSVEQEVERAFALRSQALQKCDQVLRLRQPDEKVNTMNQGTGIVEKK